MSDGLSITVEPEPAATPADASAELARPFQFGLRSMFAGVAMLSALFAVMGAVGMVWSVILVWFLLLVVAHVTANAWGTRASRRGARSQTIEVPGEGPAPIRHPGHLTFEGAARLRETRRPGWPMFVVTAAGAVAGGTLASTALWLLNLERAGYAGVVVGGISAAAVGGFLGFLASSFLDVAGHAWQEAAQAGAPPKQTHS